MGLCFKLLSYNSMECCSPPPEKSMHVQTDDKSGLLNIIYYRETKLNTIPHKRSYYSTLLLSTICLTIKIYLHCQSLVLSIKIYVFQENLNNNNKEQIVCIYFCPNLLHLILKPHQLLLYDTKYKIGNYIKINN